MRNKSLHRKEKAIEFAMSASSFVSILTTLGIIIVLAVDSFKFFTEVSIIDFFTDKEWTPLFENKHFGILPLLSGTLLITIIACLVAIPLGITIAVYLSEYASKRFTSIVKPILEVLASIPTVIYGFFALQYVTPLLQKFIPGLAGFNALSPGIVMGIMIMPYITSLSEDALRAVPNSLREASYGMGANRFQTAFKVMVPAASSGIIVSVLLAISRALGETMIVAIAAGQEPKLTFNPLESVETITTYIIQVSMGDVPQDSLEYRTIFAAGLVLFLFTFLLNNISFWVIRKFRQQYD